MAQRRGKSAYWRHPALALSLSVSGAIIVALVFFGFSTLELVKSDAQQREQLITMTDSFVSVFAQQRGQGAPIPATYRRMAIEHLDAAWAQGNAKDGKSMRMPGRPGLELKTIEEDPRLRSMIEAFVNKPDMPFIEENRFERRNFISRTIFPSVANNDACVACHNASLGEDNYQLGDVMGAFIVESDLTSAVRRNAYYAAGAFFIALAGFTLLMRYERNRMHATVAGLRKRVRLEQDKTKAEAKAAFLMSHDALTGLANRTMFRERVQNELKVHGNAGVTVGLIDLDDFKTVNDTIGHASGDALLTEVSVRLTNIMNGCGGLVARLGGDEFAVVMSRNNVLRTPEQLGQAIIETFKPQLNFDGQYIQPQCSVGLALSDMVSDVTQTEILKAADAALYAAKYGGKNLYRTYDDKIRASVGRRIKIAAALPDAISKRQIEIALQPKIDLQTGALKGFEALARWNMDGENVPPDEFVTIAQDIGLIRSLDLEVLRIGATFAVLDQDDTDLSVNLSALNFKLDGLAEAILDILMETGLRPDRLIVEVTESAAVENWSLVRDVLRALRLHGVRASLDDFGTGYSSLSYLRAFAFEEIKIDRGFITDITVDAETRFLFKSIVEMATGLGSQVVVEGIETAEQAAAVREDGAHTGQGYLFSEPLKVAAARAYLRNAKKAIA